VTAFCEQRDNEPLNSIKGKKFHYHLGYYQILKKTSDVAVIYSTYITLLTYLLMELSPSR
jgi:hypothetical protein